MILGVVDPDRTTERSRAQHLDVVEAGRHVRFGIRTGSCHGGSYVPPDVALVTVAVRAREVVVGN